MASIRDDLVGVVHIAGKTLAAGDTIPRGATVGDHLTSGKTIAKPSEDKAKADNSTPDNTDG